MRTFDEWPPLDRVPAIRLRARPAPDVWHARTDLTLYAAEPRSIVTVALHAGGLTPGDVAGLVLFGAAFGGRHAWLGVERAADGVSLVQSDEPNAAAHRIRVSGVRVWLRAGCDYVRNRAGFRYSLDGSRYVDVGGPRLLGHTPGAVRAIACSLFACTRNAHAEGGEAAFDSFVMNSERTPASTPACVATRGSGRRRSIGWRPGPTPRPGRSTPAGRVRDR